MEASERLLSRKQMDEILRLLKARKIEIPKGQIQRWKKRMTTREASEKITLLRAGLTASSDQHAEASGQMRLLDHLVELRLQAKNPVSDEERAALALMSSKDLMAARQQAQRDLQDFNDAHGVPIPQWRYRSGLLPSPEVLARNGVAGMTSIKKQPERMTIETMRSALQLQE